jgi:HD superfamily phosphohydrolase
MGKTPEDSGSGFAALCGAPPPGSKKLRDPVHKDIYLSPAELAVLDTPQLQRLRGIRQLGAAFYVYPGAQHTRFEHALGTCWMAKRIVAHIEAGGSRHFTQVERDAVGLAALAHDVTHVPFGHTFEDERKLLERHDVSVSRYEHFLGRGELAEALNRSEAGRLALDILRPGAQMPPHLRCLRQIVSGTICADLLDYLKRDNYFCGLSLEYDDRVFHYLSVSGGDLALDLQRHGLFRRDALSEVTNLLRIRYVLSERVYYHHAKIACGVMISKAVERALAGGLRESDLYPLTDASLLYCLKERFGGDEAMRELVGAFEARRLFKRCYMLSRDIGEARIAELVRAHHLNERGARTEAERDIAARLGLRPHDVAIYCPSEAMALKEADMPVLLADGRTTRFADLNRAEIQVLKEQHRALWRFYVFVSQRAAADRRRAAEACEAVLKLPNELPREMREA